MEKDQKLIPPLSGWRLVLLMLFRSPLGFAIAILVALITLVAGSIFGAVAIGIIFWIGVVMTASQIDSVGKSARQKIWQAIKYLIGFGLIILFLMLIAWLQS